MSPLFTFSPTLNNPLFIVGLVNVSRWLSMACPTQAVGVLLYEPIDSIRTALDQPPEILRRRTNMIILLIYVWRHTYGLCPCGCQSCFCDQLNKEHESYLSPSAPKSSVSHDIYYILHRGEYLVGVGFECTMLKKNTVGWTLNMHRHRKTRCFYTNICIGFMGSSAY